MTTKIVLKNVYKSFGHNHVLRGLDLELETGKSLVVMGASGSGKSVLIKCILGLLKVDSGKIAIDDINVVTASTSEKQKMMQRMGMLFQGGALFDSIRVWENVAFGLLQRGELSRKDAHALAIEKLNAVGLNEEVGNLSPAELSGGMQKRVALARAIAAKPEIIFFDEPTTGLDPIMRRVIDELIIKCVKELGATTLTITHDLESARRVGDRIAMLWQGKIIWSGTVKELDTTDNPYVHQFVNGLTEGPISVQR